VGVCAGGSITVDTAGNAHCSGSDYWETTRTLRISATEHNANPGVTDILLDEHPWPTDMPPVIHACAGRTVVSIQFR